MFKEQIMVALTELKVPFTTKGDEILCRCLNPEHKDKNPSFSINAVNGVFYCFSCGFSGHVATLLPDIKVEEDSIRNLKYYQVIDRLTEDENADTLEFSETMLPPVDHLVDYEVRGVPGELLKELGVYYCSKGKYRGRLVFPIRDLDGTLLGFDSRIHKNSKGEVVEPMVPEAKYLRPPNIQTKNLLYPLDYVSNNFDEDYIILTEGIFDAISLVAMKQPAVCNFGLGSPSPFKVGRVLSLGVTSIINGFDADTKGAEGWARIKEDWRAQIPVGKPISIIEDIRSNGKDANDFLQANYKGAT